ncbi:MAG TPA: hypothetical protein PLX18_11365 [Anaerohalosphaeraceae bacterium]|nr:hypothetical protein [Anaerohalosphaeraceae bacterium]HQG06867.1 hypothetical protein [Anaerohalosphaeraceae bacterium]HQI08440.1 hypothetical protein [Anaerohalosphaeraceae bacterium]HQJ68759.1 hypothetical protein [Anaerohalosphaeraceae bacterium]
MLCTLEQIQQRLGVTSLSAEDSAVLTGLLASVTAMAEQYCHRGLVLPEEPVTEVYTGGTPYLRLRAFPVADLQEIRIAADGDFDSAEPLGASEYRLLQFGRSGIVYRVDLPWPAEPPDSIQVVYRGGFVPAGESPADPAETPMPADLQESAVEQVVFLFKRRDDIGLSGVSFQGGSFSKFEQVDLLPQVKRIWDLYQRIVL